MYSDQLPLQVAVPAYMQQKCVPLSAESRFGQQMPEGFCTSVKHASKHRHTEGLCWWRTQAHAFASSRSVLCSAIECQPPMVQCSCRTFHLDALGADGHSSHHSTCGQAFVEVSLDATSGNAQACCRSSSMSATFWCFLIPCCAKS